MRSIKDFFALEKTFLTSCLDFQDRRTWSYLRIFIGEKFILNNIPGEKNQKGVIKRGVQNFFWGFTFLFKRNVNIAFVSSNQRKLMNGKMVHPLDLLPKDELENLLFIELPIETHISKDLLLNKRAISRYLFLAIEGVTLQFLKLFSNRNLKDDKLISEHFNVHIDSQYYANRLQANYITGKVILKWFKPKKIFCLVPYTIMGIVKASKEKNIPVIEFQHGYAGNSHRAYVRNLVGSDEYYPDYFCSWGIYEKDMLSSNTCNYIDKEKVASLGHFYLDYLKSEEGNILNRNKHKVYKTNFKYLVAVSLQDPLEDVYIDFISLAAQINNEIAFLMLPRSKPALYYKQFNLPSNVFFDNDISTYEGIILADIHSTIWSTTAFEALFFKKRNVLINPNNLSKNTFGNTLSESTNTQFAESPTKYISYIIEKPQRAGTIDSSNYFFKPNFEQNLKEWIEVLNKKERL